MLNRILVNIQVLIITLMFCSPATADSAKPVAVNLKCEYLQSPIGIDAAHPRLSWQLADSRRGAKQSAYRVLIGTDSLQLTKGIGNTWDSGKVPSDKNLVLYAGDKLQAFTVYYWTVVLWDKDQQVLQSSAIQRFETGMQTTTNWQGSWISDVNDVNLKPAPYFRKPFKTNKKIKSARAYIAVGGLYELTINGRKVGNHRLDPVYTRFDRRTIYVSHDVTRFISEGENVIGVLLGNGWYNHQSTAVWDFHKAPWRNRPTFCMDLRITYVDGSVKTIVSDRSWKSSLSPVIFNSIYTAEHYDARLEQKGWDSPGFKDSKWKNAIYRASPSQNIVSQVMHPIRNVKEISAKVRKLNDSTYLYDLGQNISGVSELKVKGERGTIIRLKHGERLDKNGHVDLSNIDLHFRPTDNSDPFQTDIFILSGTGEERFMPRFNYKGFQYVELSSSSPIQLNDQNLKGYFMHSDVPVSGELSSSNPTIDKIWKATNNSYLSNLFGYPTDCPQREKNGWTGDAHINIETGLYNYDGITIYEKWLADHRDEQQANGVLPSIIPTGGWGYEWGNGPDWTSTIAIIPWNVYLFYGDTKILEDNYESIKRYVDHLDEISPTGLTSWGLGDWVPVKSKSPVELTSSIYFYTDARILASIARVLGKSADYQHYAALAENVRGAINSKYLNRQAAIYGAGLQTELSAALYWGIVPADLKPRVAANLAKRVESDGFQLDVGLLGTKTILNALSENGYADVAYRLASRESYPSWGWWIKNGATTLYENWDIAAKQDISLNHIMFGEIGAWLYKAPGGIRPDPEKPGFKNILVEPHFVEGLDKFSATYDSPQGKISSDWKRVGKRIAYNLLVPANSSANLKLRVNRGQRLYLDGKAQGENEFKLEAGSYGFEIR